MGILTRAEIIDQMSKGNIKIEPFDLEKLGPNSYDLSITDDLEIYVDNEKQKEQAENNPNINEVLNLEYNVRHDMDKEPITAKLKIPQTGVELLPHRVYLLKTLEYTETLIHVPWLNGKSSIGRRGLTVHQTAGYGDVGYCGNWTLEFHPLERIKIYPFRKFCQISYATVTGEIWLKYNGKYQNQKDIMKSMIHLEKPSLPMEKIGIIGDVHKQ